MNLRFQTISRAELPLVFAIAQVHQSASFNWSLENLETEFDSAEFVGAYSSDGKLISYVHYARRGPGVFEINGLATQVESNGQGAMLGLLRWLFSSNIAKCEIWLEVHEQNLNARNLYEKIGFTEVSRRPSYYKDGSAAILCTYFS